MTGRSPGQSSAPVSPGSRLRMRKNESRSSSENQYEFATLRKSGRQDLNLRPLGPESDSARSDGLVSGGTEAQALDIIGIVDRADPPNGMDATPEEPPCVPALGGASRAPADGARGSGAPPRLPGYDLQALRRG